MTMADSFHFEALEYLLDTKSYERLKKYLIYDDDCEDGFYVYAKIKIGKHYVNIRIYEMICGTYVRVPIGRLIEIENFFSVKKIGYNYHREENCLRFQHYIKEDDIDMIRFFMDNRFLSDVNDVSKLYIYACQWANVDLVMYLCDYIMSNGNKVIVDGLYVACRFGTAETIYALFRVVDDYDVDFIKVFENVI